MQADAISVLIIAIAALLTSVANSIRGRKNKNKIERVTENKAEKDTVEAVVHNKADQTYVDRELNEMKDTLVHVRSRLDKCEGERDTLITLLAQVLSRISNGGPHA